MFVPDLALKIGLNEAIFIQHLHNFAESSHQVHDGYRWVNSTFEEWQQEQFPFWSVATIRRIIKKLEKVKLIVLGNHFQLVLNKQKSFRIECEILATYGDLEMLLARNEEEKSGSYNRYFG